MRADGPVDLGHLSAGPREEARARVGNGRAAPSAELDGGGGARGERHRVHVELPVPGLGDGCPRVLADEVCGVHAADDHLAPGGGPGLAVQPEGEDWRVHQPLLEEVVKGRDDPVHRDGLEAEAEDAVKLCRNESKPGLLGCLGEDLVLHLQVPQRESVLGEEPRQGAAAVLDRELLAVSLREGGQGHLSLLTGGDGGREASRQRGQEGNAPRRWTTWLHRTCGGGHTAPGGSRTCWTGPRGWRIRCRTRP
mmetsp:Transcript_38822/g.123396  ORF Transcript_38822/g.123396 Transcript_38822/m.123396 type:complete len:251 (+) Transcript_38822:505-1257(+)